MNIYAKKYDELTRPARRQRTQALPAPDMVGERNEAVALLGVIADSLVMIDPNRFVLELNADMRNEIVAFLARIDTKPTVGGRA